MNSIQPLVLQFLIFSLSFAFSIHLKSQCPPEFILGFPSQSSIDDFKVDYPDCNVWVGDLIIENSYDATNLSGLSGIDTIFGELRITSCNQLENLQGLNPNLVVQKLSITYNDRLLDLSGIEGIKVIDVRRPFATGDITISNNFRLEAFTDFTNLDTIFGSLYISSNPALTDISGLAQTTRIEEALWFSGNFVLSSLAGLENLNSLDAIILTDLAVENLDSLQGLVSVRRGIQILGNKNLTNVDGLGNIVAENIRFLIMSVNDRLVEIGDIGQIESVDFITIGANDQLERMSGLLTIDSCLQITIVNNEELPNLDGFQNVKSLRSLFVFGNEALNNLDGLSTVTGPMDVALSMHDNPELSSMAGVENMHLLDLDSLVIYNCPNLAVCSYDNVCNYLALPDATSRIWSNKDGCNSDVEIKNECLTSTNENAVGQGVLVYPNPVLEMLNVSLLTERTISSVEIIDVDARRTMPFTQAAGSAVEVNMRGVSSGVKFLVLTDIDGNKLFTKIVKL